MILCIGTTPAAQRIMFFKKLVPDTVNRAAITLDGVGGKAVNTAKVLHLLGQQVVLTGFIGGERGRELEAILKAKGVDCEWINVSVPTRQCITLIEEGTSQITELVEESQPVTAADYEKLTALVVRRLPQCRAIILSGTLAPGGTPDFYAQCIKLANQYGILSVVDVQGRPLMEALKASPGLVKPNRIELQATVGQEIQDESSLLLAMRALHEKGARRVVITEGKGAVRAFDGHTFWRVQSPTVKAVNPIGSGDSFCAALVWRLMHGDDLGEACRWGCAAGAANALTAMVGEPNPADIHQLAAAIKSERLPA